MSSQARRILLIRNEIGLETTLHQTLRGEGYAVDSSSDFSEAVKRSHQSDLILVDTLSPQNPGAKLVERLRSHGVIKPILMLTVGQETTEKILGLRLGADDCLNKPFEIAELSARLDVLLRRETTGFGAVKVDLKGRVVLRGLEHVRLSSKEFELLHCLIRNRGKALSKRKLLQEVWGQYTDRARPTVDVHIHRLRQKLEPNPRRPTWIVTVKGVGYKLRD